MATKPPFFWPLPPLPDWAIDEAGRRIVLLANHVLLQEPEAMRRLLQHQGKVILVKWGSIAIQFAITPAGLLDLADAATLPGLSLQVVQDSPLGLLQALFQGGKPDLRIEGDVQLAADVHWLTENLRWDLEEDLARMVGDVPARALADAARGFAGAIWQFIHARRTSKGDVA
jgi:ubiquinone biosynthesis accessory factor UbiJ